MSLNKAVLVLIGALCALAPFWSCAAESGTQEELLSAFRVEKDVTSDFMINIWKSGEGLPVNYVQDLKQTPDGYLWLGTHQGLVRFDGVRFETYFSTPTGTRYGTRVGPLEVDSHGQLWMAPDQVGLAYGKAGAFKEVLTNKVVLRNRVEHMCLDGDSLLWVDAHGMLGRVQTEAPHIAVPIKGGVASRGSQWIRDYKGQLWLVNPRSLKLYRQHKWRGIKMSGDSTLVAAPRRAGGLWVAREAKLWVVTADGRKRELAEFPWKGQSRVSCLLEDSQERLWIGTVGQGLFCYTAGQFKQAVPIPSSIMCLLEDRQENIWAGTRGSGLIRVRERRFFIHDLSSGLENQFVLSLAQDKEGKVWILSAEGGLGWWQNGAWHNLGPAEGWPGLDSRCVLPASDGSVWVSTTRRGMWQFSDGKFIRRELGPKAPKEPVVDLLEDGHRRLWMVTDNSGIFCLDGTRLDRYSSKDGLPSDRIRRIVQDEQGGLWAGDWEGGIARFNTNRWELVRNSSGHRDAVRSIVISAGTLWIGTSAGGLLRFKDGKTDRISPEQGLPDVCIQQLVLDGTNSLWGSTPHKLFRISLNELNATMDGREEKVRTIAYGRSDGLPDTSFADWCDPRCGRASNGELWFATANGAIHFQPGHLHEDQPPKALLESVLVNNKPSPVSALQHLRPGGNRLEFRFTAPCLTGPERVRFRYQMTGVDAEWMDAGTARVATYANLPAGDHVFRVVACSPEGIWSSQPATVALVVRPYLWQASWFVSLIAAVAAGGGVWIVRRATVRKLSRRLERLHQQHALDQERARIAQDIHDELGANLTSIGLLADMGVRHKSNPMAVTRELDQISKTARETVAAMDAIVWALNPRNDSLDHFANYLAQFTRDFFRPTSLRTRLDLPTNLPAMPMTTEMRHQLFLLVKESFNNIVRHAQATEVHLQLACEDEKLRLVVADNGKGLSGEAPAEGQDGLANLRERIERLGGNFRIQTETGRGAKLEFTLPLDRIKPKSYVA